MAISAALRSLVTERAGHRCEYCRAPDRLQIGGFELDHIMPVSRGGPTEADNLALACPACNEYKSAYEIGFDSVTAQHVPLFHPRKDRWSGHFSWNAKTFELQGKSDTGRATIQRLQLNHPELVGIRRELARMGVDVFGKS